jgi:hypothetical protein
MKTQRKLPSFASGVLITCPAPALQGKEYDALAKAIFGDEIQGWGACGKEVSLTRIEWERGHKGYCEKHRKEYGK